MIRKIIGFELFPSLPSYVNGACRLMIFIICVELIITSVHRTKTTNYYSNTELGLIPSTIRRASSQLEVQIALEKFRAEVGNQGYPAELNELVPKFISREPVDPINGQPFIYKQNGDSYRLSLQASNDKVNIKPIVGNPTKVTLTNDKESSNDSGPTFGYAAFYDSPELKASLNCEELKTVPINCLLEITGDRTGILATSQNEASKSGDQGNISKTWITRIESMKFSLKDSLIDDTVRIFIDSEGNKLRKIGKLSIEKRSVENDKTMLAVKVELSKPENIPADKDGLYFTFADEEHVSMLLNFQTELIKVDNSIQK